MENGLYCKSCTKTLAVSDFDFGYKCCRSCVEYKRANHDKHQDKVNERQRKRYEEDEEYRAHLLKRHSERGKKIVSCSVCNCSMSQGYLYKHKKTEKHKINLRRKQIEE